MTLWADYVHLLIALVAIVDIPGNLPMFLQRTGHLNAAGRVTTAITASVATLLILLVFAFAGPAILASFGITVEAFKILGGLVILIMALEMLGLRGDPARDHGGSQNSPVAIGIFPMAVPLFAGPGAISAVMVFVHLDPFAGAETHPNNVDHQMIVAGVVLTVSVLILLGLLAASALSRFLTPLVQDVLNRLLGIIVGALGIEFILEGLAAFYPVLAR
ncbi:MAG: MarC family protein [Pseudomonadota bacterium]